MVRVSLFVCQPKKLLVVNVLFFFNEQWSVVGEGRRKMNYRTGGAIDTPKENECQSNNNDRAGTGCRCQDPSPKKNDQSALAGLRL